MINNGASSKSPPFASSSCIPVKGKEPIRPQSQCQICVEYRKENSQRMRNPPPELVSCSFCSKLLCSDCSAPCNRCEQIFCHYCSTHTYVFNLTITGKSLLNRQSIRYELGHSVCLSCLQ